MTPSAQPPITGPVLLLAACLAMILGAYGFQYIGGFEPCQMCYWQRYAYYTAIPLAALAVFAAATRGMVAARLPLVLTGLALLVGMGYNFVISGLLALFAFRLAQNGRL